ncbi:MAG: hypothetical protein P8J45_02730 [Phycisphaerales bacterium]|nr:hypothetical protein [Phycisphaerales bacterium]
MTSKSIHPTAPLSTAVLAWLISCSIVTERMEAEESGFEPTQHERLELESAPLPYDDAIRALEGAGISTDEWLVEGLSAADGTRWDPELARSVLEKSARAIQLARVESRTPRLDFMPGIPEGPVQDLTMLSPLRRLSSLMAMQARDYRARGLDEQANRMLADMGALTTRVASAGAVEASLTANICAGNAMAGIEEAIALGTIDSTDATRLRESLGDGHDPLGCAGAMQSDQLQMISWLRENPELAVAISGPRTIGASFEDEVEGVESGFERIATILQTDDPKLAGTLLEDFKSSLQAGMHGAIAVHFLANHARLAGIKIDHQQRRDGLDDALRDIQLGSDPIVHADASTLYAYAFPHVRALDDEQQDALETVRRYATTINSTQSVPTESLDRAREVLSNLTMMRSLIERAGWCERCDWPQALKAKRLGSTIGEGDWLRPMRALSRVLLAEAVVARADGREQDATGAVIDCLTIALHLADGSHLLGTAVASAILLETIEVMGLAHGNAIARDPRLEQRLARVDASDPLGWRAAREATLRGRITAHHASNQRTDSGRWARRLRSLTDEDLATIDYLLVGDGLTGFRYRFECTPRESGLLFEIKEVVELTDDARKRLERAPRKPGPLLTALGEIDTIDVTHWHQAGLDALDRIGSGLDHRTMHQTTQQQAVVGGGDR